MDLPHRRQRLALFLKFNGITQADAAHRLGIKQSRFKNIIKGHTFPSPDELSAIERLLNNMPAEVYFDPAMLQWRHDWPPRRGGASDAQRLARRQASESRSFKGEDE